MSRSNGEARGPEHGRRRQAVVDRPLSESLQGRLRPGHRPVVQAQADRLGAGLTPAREALMVLAGLGMVEIRPNRGAVVRALGPSEVRGIDLGRRALECDAVRGACGRIDAGELRALHDDLARQIAEGRDRTASVKESRGVDNRLHDRIAEACGNPILRGEPERLKLLYRSLRDTAYEQRGPLNNDFRKDLKAREHPTIVGALMAGDRRRAVRAMSRHFLSGLRYFREVMRPIRSETEPGEWSSPRNATDGPGRPPKR